MTLVVKAADAARLIDMAQAIAVTESVLAEQARGQVAVHPPFHLPVPDGALRVVSGVLLESKRMGVRFGPALGLTPASGIRDHLAALYGTDGALLALVSYPFTTLRTGASVGAATKHLAPPRIGRLGVIGTGRNALALLRGITTARPVDEIRVFSRNPKARASFSASASEKFNRPILAVESNRDAVAEMDMLLVATSSLEPVFDCAWLKPGCFVASMGPIGELPRDAFTRPGRKIVSSFEQEKTPLRRSFLCDQVSEGRLRWEDIDELGDIVIGKAPAPQAGFTTIFHESAGGAGDVAFADWVYREALRLGIGQEISL
ncbi:MAG TPA: NAD(P)-binding domain-containing protein [Stellaceae bacterium]|jgi:ornithine cyclodeaminase/alanine dehydrogenase-like protein (mu-crystallin family)|nr:NAD(P)-binding domain-containing protein [Stellaceae bacterium]